MQQQRLALPMRDPQIQVAAPDCPRCASTNTKFCYYNNYSLGQPRYLCKACRRYWTKGGSLRNVPVGGGCRKSRRSRSRAPHQNTTTPPPGDSSSSSSSGGPEIDLAAVFARYVSHDVVPSTLDEQGLWQQGKFYHDVVPRPTCNDLESFDYEMVVPDDIFWSTTPEDASKENWEQMAPLQDFDSSQLLLDHQFTIPSTNQLFGGDLHWSNCFDLAGYFEDFHMP